MMTAGARAYLSAAAKMSPGRFAALVAGAQHGDGFVLLQDVRRAFPGELLSPELVRSYLDIEAEQATAGAKKMVDTIENSARLLGIPPNPEARAAAMELALKLAGDGSEPRCPECLGDGSEVIGDGTHGGTEQQACSRCGGTGKLVHEPDCIHCGEPRHAPAHGRLGPMGPRAHPFTPYPHGKSVKDKYVTTVSFRPSDGARQIALPEGCNSVLYVFDDRGRAVEINGDDDLVYLTEVQRNKVALTVDPETGETEVLKPGSLAIHPDGQFDSLDHWADTAKRRIGHTGAACFDQKGRLCASGKDFKRARDEGQYPVVYVLPDDAKVTR